MWLSLGGGMARCQPGATKVSGTAKPCRAGWGGGPALRCKARPHPSPNTACGERRGLWPSPDPEVGVYSLAPQGKESQPGPAQPEPGMWGLEFGNLAGGSVTVLMATDSWLPNFPIRGQTRKLDCLALRAVFGPQAGG